MTTLRFLAGLSALALIVVPHGLVGWMVQRVLPARARALHLVAATVLATASLVLTAAMLGAVGWFAVGALMGGGWIVALGVWTALRSVPSTSPAADVAGEPSAGGRRIAVLSGFVVVVTVARWVQVTAKSLLGGVEEYDSLTYHMPFAAEFVRSGWTTRFQEVWPDPTHVFYPATTELVLAIEMAALDRDVLVPLTNLAWLGLLLLAGWCVGLTDGRPHLTLLGIAWVATIPTFLLTNAGTAQSDTAMLALLVASLALWRAAAWEPAWMAVGGVAMGLAVGSKLTAAPIAAVVVVALVALSPRGRRAVVGLATTVPMVAAGGFWFVRNWVRSGTPLPHLDLPGFTAPDFPLLDQYGHPVIDFIADATVWRDVFLPGLEDFFGPGSALVLIAVVLASPVIVRSFRRPPVVIAVAATAAGLLGYLASPSGAWGPEGGPPLDSLFVLNLRYLLPGLCLVALLPAIGATDERRRAIAAWLLASAALLGIAKSVTSGGAVVAVALVALAGACAFVGDRWWSDGMALRRRLPSSRVLAGIAVAVVVVATAVAGPAVARHQLDEVADPPPTPQGSVFAWALGADTERIAYFGFAEHYPLYGPTWDTDTIYVGVRAPGVNIRPPRDCVEFIRAVRDTGADHVVVVPEVSDFYQPGLDLFGWLDAQPAAQLVLDADPNYVFALDGPLDPQLCG